MVVSTLYPLPRRKCQNDGVVDLVNERVRYPRTNRLTIYAGVLISRENQVALVDVLDGLRGAVRHLNRRPFHKAALRSYAD